MKTFTFAALFVLACLLVASAIADSGDSERRPGGSGAGGSRPGSPGGATGEPGAGGSTGGTTVEEDDMATLFNSINGANGSTSSHRRPDGFPWRVSC
jgi:hypothetical protein